MYTLLYMQKLSIGGQYCVLCTLIISLVSQARLSCGERVWSNSYHHLVSNTPRIGMLIGLVTNGACGCLSGMLFRERGVSCIPNNGKHAECVPIYVYTYFIRRPAAEHAIQMMGI